VPPRHCDAQGMVHAIRPLEYFEDAFVAWVDARCGGYSTLRSAGYDFVIAQTECSYLQPARLDDVLDVEVRPLAAGTTAFTVQFNASRDGTPLVVGRSSYVVVREGRPTEISPSIRESLGGLPRVARSIDRMFAAELVGRLRDAQSVFYSGGHDAPLRRLLHPNVLWCVPGNNAIAGEYQGIEAVLGYMARRRDLASGTLRLHPGELLVGTHAQRLVDRRHGCH
jgi:YbgC/YbaW family acyl-CoA thioester hydrolase